MTPTTILLATDLSCRCDRALDRATALAAQWGARLVVLHVLCDTSFASDLPSWRRPPDVHGAAQERVRRDLRDSGDIAVEVIVETGDPATAIVNVAGRLGCGLVVTGVARDETLGRVLLGTTVDAVVRKSTVPVLVVKSRPRGRYQKVVVATDYSEGARYALQATLELLPDSEITLFHNYVVPLVGLVEDKAPLLEAGASQARQGGQEFLAATPAAAGHTIPIVCEHGEIGALLQEFVTTRGIDLVALGATGRGALASILLGNVAQYLLSTLTVDVLVVRHVHPSLQSQA